MNIKLVGIVVAVGSLLACGDSGTGGAGGGSGGSNPGGSNPGGSDPGGAPGTGGGGGAALTCETGCQALFDCGLEGTPPYCVYTSADSGAFVPGCIEQCADMMSLLAIIDPADCENTVGTIKTLSASFAAVCDEGVPEGGGNAGGAGGAP